MQNIRKYQTLFLTVLVLLVFSISISSKGKELTDKVAVTNINHDNAIYNSNRFTQMEKNLTKANNSLVDLGADYTLVGENNNVKLYTRSSDLSIRVVDKITGYVWGSSFASQVNLPKLMVPAINSAITINYYSSKNNAVSEESLLRAKYDLDNCSKNCTDLVASTISYRQIANGFEADIVFGISKIALTLKVYLDDTSLKVEVPYESIKDGLIAGEAGNRIKDIRIYPFFGAVKDDEVPGYMFIPDGTGALMRFGKPDANETNPYYKRFYGFDLGIDTPLVSTNRIINEPEKIYFAVYGMVHGIDQNGFITIVDNGAEYADLYAYPAKDKGIVYQYMHANFNYRKNFVQPTNQKNTNRVTVIQQEKEPVEIKLSYIFLENNKANYVGMAEAYRNHLVNSGILTKTDQTGNIPVRIDVIGAESSKGLIFDKVVKMTTVNQLKTLVNTLKSSENNVNDLTVVYRGWSKGGLSNTSPNYFPFENSLGSNKDFVSLIEMFNNDPYSELLFHTDYIKAFDKAKGYNTNDISRRINTMTNIFTNGYRNYYYLKPTSSQKILEKDLKQYAKYKIENLAIDTIGNTLFSDYAGGVVTRRESMSIYQQLLSNITGTKALYTPNDYLLKYTDKYFDMPMYNSQYMKFSDTVPFMPIVLSGYVDTYAPHANFFADTTDELLRVIDFGLLPSFYLTNESAYLLSETASKHIYTSKFNDWESEVVRQYHFINDALKDVYGHSITSRVMLKTGVSQVTYDNDVKIIVNYTNEDFIYLDNVIKANNYLTIGVK